MAGNLVAIDPGIRGCGIAKFVHGSLQRAGYIPNPSKKGNGPAEVRSMVYALFGAVAIDEIAIEWPQVYSTQRGSDPNDLLPLVGIGCGFAVQHPTAEVFRYLPREWKASMPKGTAFEERILKILDETERDTITGPPSLLHNVYDAVGIGLYHLGRFKPTRVIAR